MQRQKLPASARCPYQDARSSSKVALQDGCFPAEETAQIVLGRCQLLRLAISCGCNRIEIIGRQATEPEPLMQGCHDPDESTKPSIGTLEAPHAECSFTKFHLMSSGL